MKKHINMINSAGPDKDTYLINQAQNVNLGDWINNVSRKLNESEESSRMFTLYNFTPREIQFIASKSEEIIEKWSLDDVVFTAYSIFRKLEKQNERNH